MLFYKITATISENIDIPSSKQREEYEEYASSFPDVNEMFYQKNHKQCYLFVAGIKSKKATIGAIVNGDKNIELLLKRYLKTVSLDATVSDMEETTLKSLLSLLRTGDRNYFVSSTYDILEDLNLSVFDGRRHYDIKYTENLLTETVNKETILQDSREMLFENSLSPEIERIYMGKSCGKTKSHPVHYLVKTDNQNAQKQHIRICFTLYITITEFSVNGIVVLFSIITPHCATILLKFYIKRAKAVRLLYNFQVRTVKTVVLQGVAEKLLLKSAQ